MPTNPPRHSPVFPVVIIIFSVDWVSLEDDLARRPPGGMHDISILRSLLFSWSDSPREEPTIHQMEETHGQPMKEVDGGLSSQYLNFSSNLLCSAYYIHLQCNWDLRYSNCLIFFGEETSVSCWLGEGQSPGCWVPRGSGGGSRGFSHSSSNLCLASHRSLTGDTPTERHANCHPVPRRQWRSLTCFRNAHLRFGFVRQQLIKYLQRGYFYDQHTLQCWFTRNRPFLGKFKVYICLREYDFYYLHFTNYEPEA